MGISLVASSRVQLNNQLTEGTTLRWDDHATWELTSGMLQKQPVVVHKEQFKTAP